MPKEYRTVTKEEFYHLLDTHPDFEEFRRVFDKMAIRVEQRKQEKLMQQKHEEVAQKGA